MKKSEMFAFILLAVLLTILIYVSFIRIGERRAISIISKSTGHDATDLANYGEDYLISWAKSIRKEQATFTYNGAKFDSKTGVKQ